MDAVAVFVNDFDFVARFIGIIPPCERCKRFFNRATAVGCFADFVVYELFNRFAVAPKFTLPIKSSVSLVLRILRPLPYPLLRF